MNKTTRNDDSSKNLLGNLTAAILSVCSFEVLLLEASFNPYINWERVIFDSIAGVVAYSITFIFLRNREKFIEVPIWIYSVVLGTVIWLLFHSAYQIYFDWRYLSHIRPETFYQRNLSLIIYGFSYVVPLVSINAFIFVGLLRLARRLFRHISKVTMAVINKTDFR